MNVWIGLITFASAFFFFEKAFMWQWIISSGSRVPYMGLTNFFFNKIFIKNESNGTIYTFKNYFITVFLVFNF